MENTKAEPIAKYRERIRCLIDRTFELYPDRVHVFGESRGAKFDALVLISDLAGSPNRVWLRTNHYHWALITVAILSVFVIVPFLTWPPFMLALIPGICVFLPALYYLKRSLKHIEYLQFKNSGSLVILDIGCVGPDAAKFRSFTQALEHQIEQASKQR